MKRERLVRELERAGCRLLRHGGNHDVYLVERRIADSICSSIG